MSKIGLTNFRYALLTSEAGDKPVYGGAKTPGKAISCTVSITNNSAKLYADDELAEIDSSFQSGTISMEIDEDDLETMADLLGHEYNKEEKQIIRKTTDIAPYVGVGRVITKMINGVKKYKVEILYKVKFSEPSQEDTTKGESVEFKTTKIEGTVSAISDGKMAGSWSDAKLCETKDEAISVIETTFQAATKAPKA